MTLKKAVTQYLHTHPNVWISSLDVDQQKIWIKRHPPSKKKTWHTIMVLLNHVIKLPILRVTVKTHANFLEEMARLERFSQLNIPVPKVLLAQREYLVTEDSGPNLKQCLQQMDDTQQKFALIEQAARALLKVHQAKLCHGRPYLRDMTLNDNVIFFLGLEEDPLKVMDLTHAQARDIWLFLNSVVPYYMDNATAFTVLIRLILEATPLEVRESLREMVFFLRPLRILIAYVAKYLHSRDINRAIYANQILEECLSNDVAYLALG